MNHSAIDKPKPSLPALTDNLTHIINFERVSKHADATGNVMIIRRPDLRISPAAREEAKAMLDAYAKCGKVDIKQLHDLLNNFNFSVVNPLPNEASFSAKASVYLNVLGDYPSYVLTPELMQEALKKFKFFPSLSELSELFDAELEKHKKIISKLKGALTDNGYYEPPPQRRGGMRLLNEAVGEAFKEQTEATEKPKQYFKPKPSSPRPPQQNQNPAYLAKLYRQKAQNASEEDRALYLVAAETYEKQLRGELQVRTEKTTGEFKNVSIR